MYKTCVFRSPSSVGTPSATLRICFTYYAAWKMFRIDRRSIIATSEVGSERGLRGDNPSVYWRESSSLLGFHTRVSKSPSDIHCSSRGSNTKPDNTNIATSLTPSSSNKDSVYQCLAPTTNCAGPFFFRILRFFRAASSCTAERNCSLSHDSKSSHCQHPSISLFWQQARILQNGGPPPARQPLWHRNRTIAPRTS